MWIQHLFSFFGMVLRVFFDSIGTTALGILVDIGFGSSIAVSALLSVRREEGWLPMLNHWHTNYKAKMRFALICVLLFYSPVVIWSMGKVVYDDHQRLLSELKVQEDSSRRGAANLQETKNDLNFQLSSWKAKCSGFEGANGVLSNQNREQQNSINTCLLHQKETPVIRKFSASHYDKPEYARMEYVVTTNTLRSPVDLIATCDFPIAETSHQFLTESGGTVEASDNRRVSQRAFEILTTSPVWTSENPIWLEIYFYKPVDRMPSCSVTPK